MAKLWALRRLEALDDDTLGPTETKCAGSGLVGAPTVQVLIVPSGVWLVISGVSVGCLCVPVARDQNKQDVFFDVDNGE